MKYLLIFFCSLLVSLQTVAAQTPDEMKAKLPTVKGWTLDTVVETFDENNLFERINGAAPGYILNHFKQLTVFVYQKKGSKDYITMQVYRHATPVDAFGIYSSERPLTTTYVKAGAEAYQEPGILNMLVGSLYVKLESPSTDAAVNKACLSIAQAFARKIDPKPQMPAALQLFPKEGRVAHAEQYIAQGFMGHEFLNSAYTATYRQEEQNYQLFIIDAGTTANAKAMLEKYFAFTKQTDEPTEGRLTIADKYNGTLECCWKGRYIWGIINDSGLTLPTDALLNAIDRNITQF